MLVDDEVWGAFDADHLLRFIALAPGWVNHLYVRPGSLRQGIGTQLLDLAQREQDKLRLYTFQSNVRARAFYEKHGFVIEEASDGNRNEERMPDITYVWRRT